jgi:Tfp pilus assembly protein PilO
MPTVLIGIAITLVLVFAEPLYKDISVLRTQMASYDQALDNAKSLENERDKLTSKFNSIDPENLRRLEKLLPQNVDNIRLILEIEQLALPYGMLLKDVKYNTAETAEAGTPVLVGGGARTAPKDYDVFDLEFSTSGSYNDFINFTKDLESNLRIVDIETISFSSDSSEIAGARTISPEIYKFNFKIKTYWLKN